MTVLTADRLRELLHYSPDTGAFAWRVTRTGKTRAGDTAGWVDKSVGYRKIEVDWRTYPAHRLAWLYMTGEWPGCQIDHIDMDKGNNRWGNLREATSSQNHANTGKRANNTSGFKGVTWARRHKKWCASVRANGKRHWLGYFNTPEAASAAYAAAAERHFGEYARAA